MTLPLNAVPAPPTSQQPPLIMSETPEPGRDAGAAQE